MDYDVIHNIKQKNQLAQEDSLEHGRPVLEREDDLSYSWLYAYQSAQAHAPSRIGKRDFFYDANGNQVRWEQRSHHDDKDQKSWRDIAWDEENRVRSILDGSGEHDKKYHDEHIQQYVYDDSGTRVLKYGHEDDLTVYVNSYYTVSDHAKASKHIFAGNIRLATLMTEYKDEKEHDRDHDEHHKHPPKPKETVFFYHGDHLGSNHYVTDKRGRVYEHLEYFPFGEQWIEEGEDGPKPKYRFTAKEWDDETGLYYYGARYYDPRTSVWASADPILGKYLPAGRNKKNLPGMGGVFNSFNMNMYAYGDMNPLKYLDPDGMADVYFVVHSTAGAAPLSKASILDYKSKGLTYQGHAYIMKDGEMIQVVDFDKSARATKMEKQDKSLRGQLTHVELNYATSDSPTEEQYNKLTDTIIDAEQKLDEGDTSVVVPHKEVDRGIPNGHSDPTNFDFDKLKKKIDAKAGAGSSFKVMSQDRYLVPNQADQKSNWPPKLEGKPERK